MKKKIHLFIKGIEHKHCPGCNLWKPLNKYGNQKDKADGLRTHCKKCHNLSNRKWEKDNPEKKNIIAKNWRLKNPESVKLSSKKAQLKRDQISRNKLSSRISVSISKSLRSNKNGHHWESLVGYTLKELMNYLEKLFQQGMTWNNYGKWHIDHKIPISAFNFNSPNDIDFKRCWTLSNLQPLWATENHSKKNSLNKPFQPSLRLSCKN